MNDPWRVTLLGGLRAERGAQSITRFKTQKVAALFAYLAFHLRQAHSREVLIALLWPESDVSTLRNSLSVALSSLRNQFEPPGVAQGTVIRADRFSVGLNPVLVTTDVVEFEQALKAAGRAGSSMEKAQHLTRAVELYQGPLLPGFYEDWISAEQERLAGRFLDALGALLAYHEGVGDYDAAISHGRHAVSVDPLREEGQQHLIRLLAAAGQLGAALRQYKEFEGRLREEYNGEPSQALRALFDRIEKQTGFIAPLATPPLRPSSPAPLTGGPATVTFLLTGIEDAYRLGQTAPEALSQARVRHHAILRQHFQRHGGREIRESDEGFIVVFATAGNGLSCAVSAQTALNEELWPEPIEQLRVRMALHTGDVQQSEHRLDDGSVLHYAGRMLTAGSGGQILVSDTTAPLVPKTENGIRLVDLGVYRLRDQTDARPLYQVEFPGMGSVEFCPPAGEAGYRSNLPPRFSRFFGREEEILRLRKLLLSPEGLLVTMTGPGGTGKTRLALEAAERLSSQFDGAVYFVPLADLGEAGLIPAAVIDSLRLAAAPGRLPLDRAVEALNRKPTLLVLDNFEQLVPDGAQVVQALLARVPSLKVLVTSRQVLGLTAEREFVVSPLPTPDGDESAEQLTLFDSVQLFIDRAQQVMPHFQVTNANAATVAGLVSGLEGIPLAIELAAARVQVLTPSQMLAQLTHRFDFLTGRKRDVSERQRTLRGAVDWSYRLLSPELQRFFSRLSVFRGGWSVEAAEAVCEEPLALDYLEQLRECSLTLHGESPAGELRFRMLETLREYGEQRLDERGEVEALKRRNFDYFLNLAEQADRQIRASGPGDWLLRLEADHDNLRAALTWSAAAVPGGGFDPRPSGVRLAGLLEFFWTRRGYFAEARERLSLLLATGAGTPADRALALSTAGSLACRQLDYPAGRAMFEQALAIRRDLGDQAAVAASLLGLGRLALLQGDQDGAHSLLEQSLAISRALGDRRAVAAAFSSLAVLADARDDLAAAESLNRETLEIGRTLDDRMLIATSLLNLGVAADRSGDYAAARRYYEETLPLRIGLGDRIGIANALHNLGSVACSEGDYLTARARLSESLTLRRDLDHRHGVIFSLDAFGSLAIAECGSLGDEPGIRLGVRLLGAAQAMRQSGGSPLPTCWRAWNERSENRARNLLGDASYAAEFEAGLAIAWEEAVALALEERPA